MFQQFNNQNDYQSNQSITEEKFIDDEPECHQKVKEKTNLTIIESERSNHLKKLKEPFKSHVDNRDLNSLEKL